jgi:N-acetyl-anhydromuramyl-L-alanine amidase AmpD
VNIDWLTISLIFGGMLFFGKIRGKNAGQIIFNVVDELPRTAPFPQRSINQISYWVIHHSLTNGGDPWAFAEYHVDNNGWSGIGYHFVIQPDGKIYQTNYLSSIAPHAGNGMNTSTVGICLVGDFTEEIPPAVQIQATAWLIRYLNATYGDRPIVAHRDVNPARTCPGDSFDLDVIRNLVYQNFA